MKVYRVYTEDLNIEFIKKLVSSYFMGFTIIKGEGYWESKAEGSLVIEIIASKEKLIEVQAICLDIKVHNKQQSVLFTVQEVKTEFI
jgi:hypothetical protein